MKIKTFKLFQENLNNQDYGNDDITINLEEKKIESYNFIKNYLNVMEFNNYVDNENLFQVVARRKGNIIGVRIFKMKDNKIHLNYSAVVPNERNQNLNKKMLNEIEKIAIENNVNVITSNVRASNLPSLRSLIGSGFQINKNYELFYPDGEKKIPLFKKL